MNVKSNTNRLTAALIFLILFSCHATAETIVVGISFSIPPYVITETGKGIELEILYKAFNLKGHSVIPKFLPLERTFRQFDRGDIDGVINVKEGLLKTGYYTDVVIHFQNCAVSLAKNNYPVDLKTNHLVDKKVIAFQRASVLLGEEFRSMARSNPRYTEVAKQVVQIKLLFSDRTDFVVMDKNIFNYYRNQVKQEIQLNPAEFDDIDIYQDVSFHTIVPPTEYRFAFRDKSIRDDFNEGLKIIRKNGTYEKIITEYISK